MARGGISGLAVTIGAAGLYLVFAGVRNVPIVEGIRELARGRVPAGKAPETTTVGRSGARASSGPAAGMASAAGLIRPIPGTVGDGFGAARPGGRKHKGIDIAASTGTPVRAAAAGAVIGRGYDVGAGNYINLGHSGSAVQKTKYFHLSDFAVGHGAPVQQGQVIGYVGSTGNSSGPHLHFEVWVGGEAVDPMLYLPG